MRRWRGIILSVDVAGDDCGRVCRQTGKSWRYIDTPMNLGQNGRIDLREE